jgi:NADH-quinone oxidoreductase subunit M
MSLGFPLLSLILWLPALGALLLFVVPRAQESTQRALALLITLLTLALSIWLLVIYPAGNAAPQFVERRAWLPSWGIEYHLGVDGINLWLVVLTAFIAPFAVSASWSRFVSRPRAMLALLLLLQTTFFGVFLAQDLVLFYVFYELALIPAVFLVGVWGGENRVAAATRFFLYTFAGSVLMLGGIIALYALHRAAISTSDAAFVGSFDVQRIAADLRSGAFVLEANVERLIFFAFLLAFAIKLGLWPFHTWVPATYSAAPTAALILIAALMSKFGTYGLIRFNLTLFPQAAQWAAPAIGILAAIGILYAGWTAFGQQDMRRVVAYSSVSHMNFIALGIFALNAIGLNGALFQMVSHALTTAALFLLIAVLYERREQRELNAFGGLWSVMPGYTRLMLIVLLAAIGLPGLSGFIGEYMLMQGALSSPELGGWFAAAATIGLIFAAAYMLRMFRIVFMGNLRSPGDTQLPDLNRREWLTIGLLALPLIALGLYPNLIFGPLTSSVDALAQQFDALAALVGR